MPKVSQEAINELIRINKKYAKPTEYIKGFKHGVVWCLTYNRYKMKEKDYEDTLKGLKQAVKSLKEGR